MHQMISDKHKVSIGRNGYTTTRQLHKKSEESRMNQINQPSGIVAGECWIDEAKYLTGSTEYACFRCNCIINFIINGNESKGSNEEDVLYVCEKCALEPNS